MLKTRKKKHQKNKDKNKIILTQWQIFVLDLRINSFQCAAVNGCRQNESQWMRCSEWVPSEWESMDGLQWMGAVRMRVNGCAAVNGCRQNESQWMVCSEWVPSEWESMDGLQWMGAVRMRFKWFSAVNGCRQNESQWMVCSEWVPSEWDSKDSLQWMGAVRMRVNGCAAVNGCRQNESQWMLCSEWVPSEWESMDALQWMGAVRMRVNGCAAVNGCRQNESQWMLCSEWVPSEWESMDALQWMGAILTAPIHCRASIAEPLMLRHISPNLMKKECIFMNGCMACSLTGAVRWRLVNQRVDCSSHPTRSETTNCWRSAQEDSWSHSPPDTNSRARESESYALNWIQECTVLLIYL